MAVSQIGTNDPALSTQLTSLQQTVNNFRKNMLAGDEVTQAANARKLSEFQQALFNDVRDTFHALQSQNVTSPLRPDDLPPNLRGGASPDHRGEHRAGP